jgi:hypothetical protein
MYVLKKVDYLDCCRHDDRSSADNYGADGGGPVAGVVGGGDPTAGALFVLARDWIAASIVSGAARGQAIGDVRSGVADQSL